MTAATACARHMLVPSTSVTARSCRTGRHGAHHPNGSPGGGSLGTLGTPPSSRPRDHDHMPWSNSRPRSARYGREHRTTREQHMTALRAAGAGRCAERVCLHRTRLITPDMDLHLCHDPTGQVVLGLGHADCNRHEAAVRARRMQRSPRRVTRQSALRW